MSHAVVLLAVPGVMILGGVAACGSSTPAATATSSTVASPTSDASSPEPTSPEAEPTSPEAEPTGGEAAPASSDAPDGGGATPACAAADIEATLTEQPQRREGDSRMAMVHLLNTSDSTCRVAGWPVITLANAADEAVAVPTKNVAQPGESVPTDLSPGGGAYAGIKWTICDKADTDCPAGNTIKVGLKKGGPVVVATLEGFPGAEQSGITFKSLQVGTIQPSNQGVVAW